MIRIVVVLPAPFGPRKPVTRPGRTVKLRSSSAVNGPKRLLSRPTSIMPRLPSARRGAGRRRRARLQPGPAGQAMLAGDGGLGVVQGTELARGQAAFRLEFQVTQARPGGQ